jgi:acyl-CoA dehydrogenase
MNPDAHARQALHDAVTDACSDLDDIGWHPRTWNDLTQMGVSALTVPEAMGGGGADLGSAATVLLALGAVGASVPIVEHGLMAGWLLELAGARLPTGILTAALASELEVGLVGDGCVVSGVLRRVPWARYADRVVVLTTVGDTRSVLVLNPRDAEIRLRTNVAGEARDDVIVSARTVSANDLYRLDGPDSLAVDLLRRGAFGRSAMMAGAAQGVCAYAAQYAGERRQFGRPLAAMQAVQQLLGQLAAEVSAMTVSAEAAAYAVDRDPSQLWTLEAARIRIAAAAGNVAAIGHQIHGAIGITDEHPLHRLTTRLWAWREEYGNQAAWSDRLGLELTRKDDVSLWERITS